MSLGQFHFWNLDVGVVGKPLDGSALFEQVPGDIDESVLRVSESLRNFDAAIFHQPLYIQIDQVCTSAVHRVLYCTVHTAGFERIL